MVKANFINTVEGTQHSMWRLVGERLLISCQGIVVGLGTDTVQVFRRKHYLSLMMRTRNEALSESKNI